MCVNPFEVYVFSSRMGIANLMGGRLAGDWSSSLSLGLNDCRESDDVDDLDDPDDEDESELEMTVKSIMRLDGLLLLEIGISLSFSPVILVSRINILSSDLGAFFKLEDGFIVGGSSLRVVTSRSTCFDTLVSASF